jgi:signal transduction histidine kinase
VKARGPWLVFAIAFVIVAGVMVGVTSRLVTVERERIAAQRRAVHEEEVRLALWRLDSAATPLLSQEIAAVGLLADAPEAAAAVPRPPEVRARFVAHTNATVVAVGEPAADLPMPIDALVTAEELIASLADTVESDATLRLENPVADGDRLDEQLAQQDEAEGYYTENQQKLRNAVELSKRSATVDDNVAWYGSSFSFGSKGSGASTDGKTLEPGAPRPLEGGAVRPVWIGEELVLVRRVHLPSGPAIHGSWLHWPALRSRLQGEIDAALPESRLVPVIAGSEEDRDRLLATLPVRLDPGPMPAVAIDALGVLGPSLALGWAGMLAAAFAVFALLRWSLALSERRAAFVSAVTHELRTPLTTFRMYAEMLSEGMVDEAKRTRYLATLRREADRLGDLVENVLAYSRIESDRAPLVLEDLPLETLLQRTGERLEERARAADLRLAIDLPPALKAAIVRADPAAVEQILFNLVDNAAKYGPSRTAPRIELDACEVGRRVALRVRDHGPGIAATEQAVIFEPFAKAAAETSGTKPGVGLGLALSRRLARQLGGDLTVENAGPGARFVLTLPRVQRA